jgi:hypothetical protein
MRPWAWWPGSVAAPGTVELRKVPVSAMVSQPRDYPELGSVNTLLSHTGGYPGETPELNVLQMRLDFHGDAGQAGGGLVQTRGFVGQGNAGPVTYSALVKVNAVGTGQAVSFGIANLDPGRQFTAPTADWVPVVETGDFAAEAGHVAIFECVATPCFGRSEVAIALPHVGFGHRDTHRWTGWSPATRDAPGAMYFGGIAALAMCRQTDTNTTADAVLIRQGENGDAACRVRGWVCREERWIHIEPHFAAHVEENTASCDVMADYSRTVAVGAWACCTR